MLSNTCSSNPPQAAPSLRSTMPQARAKPDGVALSSSAPGSIRAFSAVRRLEPRLLPLAAQSGAQSDAEVVAWQYSDCHFHPTGYIQQGRAAAELVAEMTGCAYATRR